jgi:molecular chaperone Hsp33
MASFSPSQGSDPAESGGELHKFIFQGLPVRGMLVRLTGAWRQMLAARSGSGDFPAPVRQLLGEMCAAATLMQANIKFNGSLILQMQGDGPLKLAVAEVQPDLRLRSTAQIIGVVPAGAELHELLNLNGQGRCAITLDPLDRKPGQQPYQGVVPLSRDDESGRLQPLRRLSDVIEHYMRQSEQLDTRLVLAANDEMAAGLLIQRLPVEGGSQAALRAGSHEAGASADEDFQRIALLAATLKPEELLGLDVDSVLHRLFWEQDVRRFEPLSGDLGPRFACTCSRARVGRMLTNLGRDEADSVIAERGRIEVACEFCGVRYEFDAIDVTELFLPGSTLGEPPHTVQ